MTRRMPGALCRQPPESVRARTKATPRPRLTPGPPLARDALPLFPAAPDTERINDRVADLDGPFLCCRASFFAWVRKLFALPARGVSERMRPGFGRKRISSSALIAALRAKMVRN